MSKTTGNSTFKKLAVQCSAYQPRLMVNQSLVLRFNPPRRMVKTTLLSAANRFGQIDQIDKQKVEKGKSLENSR